MNYPKFFNRLWLWSQAKDHKEFVDNQHGVKAFQLQKLQKYLAENARTQYGLAHNFAQIANYETYAASIPIIEDYTVLNDYITAIAAGSKNILTKEKVLFFESTSGSSGNSKWIPYTKALKTEFQKGVATWLVDTHRQNPKVFSGKSYWSISPPFKSKEMTSGGLRVGMSADTDYFNPLDAFLIEQIMAVPSKTIKVQDSNAFYNDLCLRLLSDESLSFVSVWSPNYLLQLDEFMRTNWIQLLIHLSKSRRQFLQSLGPDFDWKMIFSNLQLVSCWTEAQSQLWLPQVTKILGDVKIQAKGLLSTEGVTTIPFHGQNVLAYTSHFYEFKDISSGQLVLFDGLVIGSTYEVILTTGGGLYRYNTHDLVVLSTYLDQLPVLQFIGKSNDVSDLLGEKINPQHLYPIFSELISDKDYNIRAMYMHPVKSGNQVIYEVILESDRDTDFSRLSPIIEAHLQKNPYYAQSRGTGQLLPLRIQQVKIGFTKSLLNFYKAQKQIKDGDVKLPILFKLNELTSLINELTPHD
ncbi:MAG: GH3 auxin-responsive promoter family protein [Saprospiraceae bacterium]|nr:GH3 auxin-responsive promoter family protein [Saprospiraceae bacterium]